MTGSFLKFVHGDRICFFKAFNLLPRMSSLDNVALPLVYAGVSTKQRRVRAQEMLELVLGDRLKNKPNQLSGGQRQRGNC